MERGFQQDSIDAGQIWIRSEDILSTESGGQMADRILAGPRNENYRAAIG